MDFYDFFNINRAVSSHFRHRDHSDSPETSSLVPPLAPRPHGIPGHRQSRPTFGTETSRIPRKPAVSSLSQHRDHSESPENQQSRPTSGTETSRIPREPIVSSHLRHRDLAESPEISSLVPPPAPRPLGIAGNRQSRPTSGTETTQISLKSVVSSHFRHRDLAESPETGSLVPSLAPRPHEIAGNRQSRPSSGTETSRIPRKPEVSSLLQHRDHADSPERRRAVFCLRCCRGGTLAKSANNAVEGGK